MEKKVLAWSGNLRLVSNFRRYRKPERIAKESVVYSLGPNDSGIQPHASLISDKAADLFGTWVAGDQWQQPPIT